MSVTTIDRVSTVLAAPPVPSGIERRVLVVSPYVVVRAGLESMLEPRPTVRPHDPDPRGAVLRNANRRRGADVVLIDSACLETPLIDEFLCAVAQPSMRVLVLARPQVPTLTDRALDLGADGCVPLHTRRAELGAAVTAVRRRQLDVDTCPAVLDLRLNPYPAPTNLVTDSLSLRELEVLACIARGISNPEIASQMFVSINTVKTYVRSAYRKIGTFSRTQATLWGLEHRISDLDRRARMAAERAAAPSRAGLDAPRGT